jgi:hypothetical protein
LARELQSSYVESIWSTLLSPYRDEASVDWKVTL